MDNGATNDKPAGFSLLSQWFGVPFLIVATIVGGAVLVVFLFGAPAQPERRDVDSLLQVLEASSGEKSAGMLLPREKELWQTALELTTRLEKKEVELSDDEVLSIAKRLAVLVKTDLRHVDRLTASGGQSADDHAVRSRRLEFVIHALGRTERVEAVKPLIDVVRTGREPYVRVAMQELGNLHELGETRASIRPVLEVLTTAAMPETLLTACTVLSVIADEEDAAVIEALKSTRLAHEGEVAWSASLALSRLGSPAGKSTLMDLHDLTGFSAGERYQATDSAGRLVRYAMPPHRVDDLLIAAMDAVSNLDDPELGAMVERLTSDPSPTVRGRAMAVVSARGK